MNICIVEGHLLIAQLLQNLFSSDSGSHYFIKTFESGEDFLSEDFTRLNPDVILIDISLPGIDGLTLIDKVKERGINGKLIILTSSADMNHAKMAMLKGIHGYLTKDLSKEELLEAVNYVMRGGKYINRSLKDKIVEYQFNPNKEEKDFKLSSREMEVLLRLCKGYAHKEIASEMELSIHTVHHYIKNLMAKLKVNRSTDLVLLAIQYGLYVPQKPKY